MAREDNQARVKKPKTRKDEDENVTTGVRAKPRAANFERTAQRSVYA